MSIPEHHSYEPWPCWYNTAIPCRHCGLPELQHLERPTQEAKISKREWWAVCGIPVLFVIVGMGFLGFVTLMGWN